MKITGRTKIVGIFGHPVGHTFSPAMHNAAFEALGLDYRYLAFDVRPELLRKAVEAIRALGLSGVNVTVPHKEKVVRYLDQLSPDARRIGAVNTIEHREGQLIGHNTDGIGFIRSFQEQFGRSVEASRVLLLGAGGAARAVGMQLAAQGAAEIIIANRTYSRARRLVKAISEHFPSASALAIRLQPKESLEKICARSDVLINATASGMRREAPLLGPKAFHPGLLVCDLIYNPPATPLLEAAARAGCRTLNGLGMLLYQGALAFEIWVRAEPSLPAMREALEKSLYSPSPPS